MHSWWDRRNCEHDVISPIVKPVSEPRMHNKDEESNYKARTIRNVDAGRNATAAKRDHVERGEVGLEECVLFVRFAPRQSLEKHLGVVDQCRKDLRCLFVDSRHKPCKLSGLLTYNIDIPQLNVACCQNSQLIILSIITLYDLNPFLVNVLRHFITIAQS